MQPCRLTTLKLPGAGIQSIVAAIEIATQSVGILPKLALQLANTLDIELASMSDTLRSELLGTAGLSIAAVGALFLTVFRGPTSSRAYVRHATTVGFVGGILIQVLHFTEEYTTGFFSRFPSVLGLSPWSRSFFVSFNLCWIAIWLCSAVGLRAGYRAAFFPVWFFAIAAMANGVVHPLLSIRTGGYFPGLLTSPLLGIIGVWLWRRLVASTAPRYSGEGDRGADKGER